MTIMHDTFFDLLEEYPDLEVEVRSILLARSQEGATIADIQDDYRKNLGLDFPICQNITEFLLSIPYVTAYCNEYGRLIFNVRPSPKTQHIYDMVQQQKPQQQPTFYQQQKNHQQMEFDYVEQNQFQNWRNNNQNVLQNEFNNFWNDRNKKLEHQYNNDFIEKKNIDNNNKNGIPININVIQTNNETQPANKIGDVPIMTTNEEKIVRKEEPIRNNYYQDNCNHLFNRLHYPPTNLTPKNSGHNFANKYQAKSNNRDTKLFNQQQKSQFKTIQQQNFFNKQENQLNPFKRPLPPRAIRPSTSRASSPSVTKSSRYNESIYTTDSDYEAHLLDFPLLGDDFFLFLARMELRCKFKKFDKVLQSGLCVSGQTIGAAIKRIRLLEDQCKSIIVNIGSVDIMKGRPLVQIQHDFRELLNLMFKKGYTPILTTLAPLANYAHDKQAKYKLYRFNEFIKKEGRFLIVMDIWSCLVNERGQILFDCFQNEPRMVTGASEPYVFWNKIGRQRVLQLIESQLEY
ncbi:maternal effect protein oskar [Eurosta solidaginis]|uniref:maternal effect protein oskar n=1 Tax=Eurosta solidaginis TaxID=178769 RepID=UPI003530587F